LAQTTVSGDPKLVLGDLEFSSHAVPLIE